MIGQEKFYTALSHEKMEVVKIGLGALHYSETAETILKGLLIQAMERDPGLASSSGARIETTESKK
jgi:hypothetical protein